MRIACFINPNAEMVKKKGSRIMAQALAIRAHAHRLHDMSDLPGYVDKYAQQGLDRVVIEGGDGTVQAILSAFLLRYKDFDNFPEFVIIAGGMTNQIARNVGLVKANASTVKRLLKTYEIDPIAVPLLCLKRQNMPDTHGFLFSTGAVPFVTDYVKTNIHSRGIGGGLAVFFAILQGVLSTGAKRNRMMPPSEISMILKGGEQAQKYITLTHLGTLVTTLNGLMLNIDPFWGKGEAPLRITFAGADVSKLFWNMLSLWRGRTHIDRSSDKLESYNADQIDFEYAGPCMLDGEPIGLPDNHVTISVSQPVSFVR